MDREEFEIEVLVDHRDLNAEDLAQAILKEWMGSPAARSIKTKVTSRVANNLEVGDIVISRIDCTHEGSSHPSETRRVAQPLAVIERKSIHDLLASIKDRRYPNQFFRLTQTRAPVLVLMMVGEIAALKRLAGRFPSSSSSSSSASPPSSSSSAGHHHHHHHHPGHDPVRAAIKQCVSAMMHVPLMTWGWVQTWQLPSEEDVPVAVSKMIDYLHRDGYVAKITELGTRLQSSHREGDEEGDAERLLSLPEALVEQRRQVADDEDAGVRMVLKKGKKRKAESHEDRYLAVLCSLDGISAKLAKGIVAQYPTLPQFIAALQSGDTLQKVPGVGKERLKMIRSVLIDPSESSTSAPPKRGRKKPADSPSIPSSSSSSSPSPSSNPSTETTQ